MSEGQTNTGKQIYNFAWKVGTALSFMLYYSGICALYKFVRQSLLKRTIAIVLTYHSVCRDTYDHMTVLQQTLDSHLRFLSRCFTVIPLAEMVDYYNSGKWPDKDVVAVSFDDGFLDNLTLAVPILKKYEVSATVFMTTDWIGAQGMLSKADILELQSSNITIGAHTMTHARLADISREIAEVELKESKAILEKILNKEVRFVAYPKGKQSDVGSTAVTLAEAVGYHAAFSTENGLINKASNIFFLPRLGIRNIPLFVFKVRVSGLFESPICSLIRKMFRLT